MHGLRSKSARYREGIYVVEREILGAGARRQSDPRRRVSIEVRAVSAVEAAQAVARVAGVDLVGVKVIAPNGAAISWVGRWSPELVRYVLVESRW